MKRMLRLTLILLACSLRIFAQATSSNAPEPQNAAATQSSGNETDVPAPNPETIRALENGASRKARDRAKAEDRVAEESALDGVDVLTDTSGVNLNPYLSRVVRYIRVGWRNLVPEVARPPIMKRGAVSIQFAILRDGTVAGMMLTQPSGDISLDRAAWGGITSSNPLPPLPTEFSGQSLALRLHFYYNPLLGGISPSRTVQVAVGSSQQFTPKFRLETPLEWSIAGSACAKEPCGTITEAGLYIAPRVVPNPPTVKITATANSDLGETASALVTIVALPPK